MIRLVPYPLLSLFLLAMWLLLQQSVSLGNLLLGSLIALGAGKAMSALAPEPIRLRRPWVLPTLAGIVILDIIRSNLAVAWIIVTRGRRLRTSGFLEIELTLRDRNGLALLAIILTATPGTVWLEFDPVSGILLIHVLDLVDEAHWRSIVIDRYERLILEAFA